MKVSNNTKYSEKEIVSEDDLLDFTPSTEFSIDFLQSHVESNESSEFTPSITPSTIDSSTYQADSSDSEITDILDQVSKFLEAEKLNNKIFTNRVQEEIKCLLEKTTEEGKRYERIHKEIENIEKDLELRANDLIRAVETEECENGRMRKILV